MVINVDSYYMYYLAVTLLAAAIVSWFLKLNPGPKKEQGKKICGVDILQFLQNRKPLPIGLSTGWKLCNFQHDHRIWKTDMQSPLLGGQVNLHACYSKIKGSSQNLLNTLKDATKYPEWHSGVHKVKYITMAPDLDSNNKTKSKNTVTSHVLNDVISVETDVSSSQMVQFINKMSQKLQGDSLIRKIHLINRYWHKEDKECSWLLEVKEESREWTFYLIQAIEGLFELDQCMLTVIHCQSLIEENEVDVIPALRLGCLRHYVLYRKVQCAPVAKLTLPVHNESQNDEENINEVSTPGGSPTKTPHRTLLDEIKQRSEENPKNESNFIKRVRSFVEERKEWYEERKKKNALVSKSSSTSQSPRGSIDEKDFGDGEQTDNNSISSEHEELDNSDFTDFVCSETNQEIINGETEQKVINDANENGEDCPNDKEEGRENATNGTVAMDEIDVIDPSEVDRLVPLSEPVASGKGNARQRLFKFLKSSSFSSVEETQRKATLVEEKPEESKMGKLKLRLMQKMKSLDLEAFKEKDDKISEEGEDKKSTDVETVEDSVSQESESQRGELSCGIDGPVTEEERLEAEYLDIADKAAAELLLEKLHIANIEISRSYEEQALMTGGWIYCGLEKEVVVLRKIYEDGIPLQSYMGKGLIPVAPKTVYEAISNPRTRCIYDEMLKKVDILHEFDNGMKIVHMYHEVSQLFRKEPRDFCILQSERIEGVKYLISLQSVDWHECRETEDVPRAKMISSGWIIEPAMKDKKLYSMVTYITQMELGHSKLNTGYLVEELAAKQPLSIYHLRQYLAPSALPSRLSSPSAKAGSSTFSPPSSSYSRQRSSSNTLAATAAAAESSKSDLFDG